MFNISYRRRINICYRYAIIYLYIIIIIVTSINGISNNVIIINIIIVSLRWFYRYYLIFIIIRLIVYNDKPACDKLSLTCRYVCIYIIYI